MGYILLAVLGLAALAVILPAMAVAGRCDEEAGRQDAAGESERRTDREGRGG